MKCLVKTKVKNFIIFSTIASLVILFLFLIQGCSNKEKDEINIGSILALTGKGDKYSQSTKNGIDLALEEINSQSNRNKKINIIYEDSLSETQKAVSAFNKLVDVNKVPVIIGPILSNEVLACAPIANTKKVVILAPAAGSEDIRKAGDYIFKNRESALPQARMIADLCASTLKLKTFIILYSNTPNGKDYGAAFKKRIEELGATILLSDSFEEGLSDYRAQLAKIRTKNPNALYIAGLTNEIANIVKQSKELNIKSKIFTSAGIEDPKLFEIAGNAAEGVIFGSPAFDPHSDEPIIKEFVNKYKNKYGIEPDFFAANGYDALKMIISTIDSNGYNSEGIKKGLYNTKNYPGVGGITTFDSDGEVSKPVIIKIIKNHKFQSYIF